MFTLSPLHPTFDAALRDVTARKPTMRAMAASSLGTPPNERVVEAIEGLKRLSADTSAYVREHAIVGFGRIGAEACVQPLIAAASDDDKRVRQAAIIALGRCPHEKAIVFVRGLLRDARAEMRMQATASLAEMDPEHACADLIPMLADADPEVRAQAASCLGAIEATGAADPLRKRLTDDDRTVRLEAALALGKLKDRAAVDPLRRALEERDFGFAAAEALGDCGTQDAREDLRRIAHRWLSPSLTRAAAAGALHRLGDPAGTALLRKMSRSLRKDVRAYAQSLLAS